MEINLDILNAKRVVRITDPHLKSEGAIVTLHYEDGGMITIHGNDCGNWMTRVPGMGQHYTNFSEAVDRYNDFLPEVKPVLSVSGSVLSMTHTPTGQILTVAWDQCMDVDLAWLERVLSHPCGLDFLADSIICGPFYRLSFREV